MWFGPRARPLFGWFHSPGAAATGAVVLCPPIARDHLQSHYAMRRLAERAAAGGLGALRFEYDGTGDSAGSSQDPGRVDAWLDSIGQALRFVRASGVRWVALAGMRLGALLAAEAAGRDGAVDALVLWDPTVSGQAFLSEQRLIAKVALGDRPDRSDGGLEIPGLVLDAQAVTALRAIKVGAVSPLARRVLVLTRPGPAPARLQEALAGEDVTWGEATGQAELIDAESPHQVLPDVAIDRIAGWLSSGAGTRPVAVGRAEPAGPRALEGPFAGVVERPVSLGPLGLFGFVTEPPVPSPGPTVVFLSVANEHHIGPNRLWVDLARRLALAGFRSARVDLSGLGDSPVRPGQPEFVSRSPLAFDDVLDAARALAGDDPSNVVLVGLCSAAYQALESALDLHPRGVVAINPVLSFQPPEVLAGGHLDPRRRVAMPRTPLVQAFHHEGPLSGLRRRFPDIGWRVRGLMDPSRRSAVWLRQVVAGGTDLLLVCGDREARPIRQGASARTLGRLSHSGRLRFEYIEGLDHGLLRADHRAVVSDLVVAHLVERFSAGSAPAGHARAG
ncbi:MAG TPA: hypothetical protein VLZ77_07295 [Acidimicrobiales bacterium]|nr:hypothetical protein [Acidimicrobiales bacterium]